MREQVEELLREYVIDTAEVAADFFLLQPKVADALMEVAYRLHADEDGYEAMVEELTAHVYDVDAMLNVDIETLGVLISTWLSWCGILPVAMREGETTHPLLGVCILVTDLALGGYLARAMVFDPRQLTVNPDFHEALVRVAPTSDQWSVTRLRWAALAMSWAYGEGCFAYLGNIQSDAREIL